MILHDYHEQVVSYDLSYLSIKKPLVLRNLSTPVLYEEALRYELGSAISGEGSLAVSSHKYTGRLPKEKRFVKDNNTEDTIYWGDINISINETQYNINRTRALDYLDSRTRIYVVDGMVGWDKRYRLKVRTICSRGYHALFMRNMLIVPSAQELEEYGDPDFTIINGGVFPANRSSEGITSDASIMINFTQKEMVILGTEYAGEMKKGVFTIMNYYMPKQQILPMHCAANNTLVDTTDQVHARNKEHAKNTTLFFGLSGTGKTTLSSDASAELIGDDEHCWTDQGIFNMEGGCYAKCVDPPYYIKECLIFGSLLENVVYDIKTRYVDFHDESMTTNTRASYPLSHVKNARKEPHRGLGNIPKNIVFLSCDAFGVLPPLARLNTEQALYYFISGYTSKIPNTEVGITEPVATFSACFGEVFLPLDPLVYVQLFSEKIKKYNTNVWLVNTGWIGGDFKSGKRISLTHTQTIINAICTESCKKLRWKKDEVFGFDACERCEGIDNSLIPKQMWKDATNYDTQVQKLVAMFHENIKKYPNVGKEIIDGGPH